MKKAQEVRKRRLEAKKKIFSGEAEKIFDWTLDLIDSGTEAGNFNSLVIRLVADDDIILNSFNDKKYNLEDKEYNLGEKIMLFQTLKNIIDKEEGYDSNLKLDDIYFGSKCVTCEILVE